MLIPNKFNGYARDGRRLYAFGGDSGGGGSPQQATSSATTVPEYARPYFEDLLGRTQALTSTPMQQYQGERVAGFTPLQQQAFTTAGGMKTGPEAFAEQVPQYMSPYQQNVIDVQKREAGRQSDIQGQKQQAQATQAGAFGGYREGIERAERERNLATQMGDIQAKGSQDAFDRATGAFNTGQQQTQDIAKLQAGFGGQQQGVQQQFLTQQYQDFINQQNAPYKQLGFMSDVLHGIPGTQSASNVYQAPPSPVSQAAGLGALAYGLSKKKGGVIDVEARYADGGPVGAAPNVYEMANMASEMTDEQLQQAVKMRPNDPALLAEVQRRQRMRASGLAALPAAGAEYADGGIVAFADGGATEDDAPWYARPASEGIINIPDYLSEKIGTYRSWQKKNLADARKSAKTEEAPASAASRDTGDEVERLLKRYPAPAPTPAVVAPALPAPPTAAKGLASLPSARRAAASFKPSTMEAAIADRDKAAAASNAETEAAFSPYRDMLSQERTDIDERRKGNEKEGWITAGLGMLAGTSPHAGVNIGEGGIKGFKAYKDAEKADDAAKKANTQAQMLAMQAERAERSGNLRDATLLRNQVRQEEQAAAQLALQADQLRVQAIIANKAPAEIQIAERVARERKIPFSEALQFLYGARQEPKNEAALRAQWSKDIMLRTQYPNFEDYARIMGASGGTSGLSAADAALVNKYSK